MNLGHGYTNPFHHCVWHLPDSIELPFTTILFTLPFIALTAANVVSCLQICFKGTSTKLIILYLIPAPHSYRSFRMLLFLLPSLFDLSYPAPFPPYVLLSVQYNKTSCDYFDPSSRLFTSFPELFSWWWATGFLQERYCDSVTLREWVAYYLSLYITQLRTGFCSCVPKAFSVLWYIINS